MTTPFGYFDLLEAFAEPGCAICRLLERDVERFLDTLLYEHVVDPPTQIDFRASRGLCHAHAWRLMRFNDALAVAILYDQALDEIMTAAEKTPAERSGGWRLRGDTSPLASALEASKPCPACLVRERAEDIFVRVLGEYVTDDKLGAAFRASDGLCLPHLRLTLNVSGAQQARQLSQVQQAKWASLKAELELFMRKMDAHYHEAMSSERTSPQRALARLAGELENGT